MFPFRGRVQIWSTIGTTTPDTGKQQQLHHRSNEPKQIEWLCVNSASNVSAGYTNAIYVPLLMPATPSDWSFVSSSSVLQSSTPPVLQLQLLEFCLLSIPSSITVSAWQICLLLYLICLSSHLARTSPFDIY